METVCGAETNHKQSPRQQTPRTNAHNSGVTTCPNYLILTTNYASKLLVELTVERKEAREAEERVVGLCF